MKEQYIHTEIGIIDTSNEIEGYVCGDEPGIVLGKRIQIKSCLTKVIVTKNDGTVITVEPILIESCMKPEIKTIMPITFVIEKINDYDCVMSVSNKKLTVNLMENGELLNVHTEEYVPKVKRADCAECNNCGRC